MILRYFSFVLRMFARWWWKRIYKANFIEILLDLATFLFNKIFKTFQTWEHVLTYILFQVRKFIQFLNRNYCVRNGWIFNAYSCIHISAYRLSYTYVTSKEGNNVWISWYYQWKFKQSSQFFFFISNCVISCASI